MLSCTVESRGKDLSNLNSEWSKAIEIADNQELLQSILAFLEEQNSLKKLNNTGIPRMLQGYFYEMACIIFEWSCDIGPSSLYDFFHTHSTMDLDSVAPKKVKHILNYLNKAFPVKIAELSGDSWVINLYLLTSNLLTNYVMDDREDDLNQFYRDFWVEAEALQKEEEIPNPEFTIHKNFLLAMSSGTTGEDE